MIFSIRFFARDFSDSRRRAAHLRRFYRFQRVRQHSEIITDRQSNSHVSVVNAKCTHTIQYLKL